MLQKTPEKQLKNLNKAILSGREKHALKMALALLIGITLGKAFATGLSGMLSHLLFGAWITFAIFYIITYITWPKKITRAQAIAATIENAEVAAPPAPKRFYLLLSIIIVVVTATPTFFRHEIITWAQKIQQDATIEITFTTQEKGGKEKTTHLIIPKAYYHKEFNSEIGIELFKKNAQKITLVATLHDMQHLPIIHGKVGSKPKFYTMKDGKKVYTPSATKIAQSTPTKNSNIIAISLLNSNGAINNETIPLFTQTIQKKLTSPPSKQTPQYGLDLFSGEIELKNTEQKTVKETLTLGTPIGKTNQHSIIACNTATCSIITNFKNTGLIHIITHPSQLQNWLEIRKKTETLLNSFIKQPDTKKANESS